jgi:YHS domain-containing protein
MKLKASLLAIVAMLGFAGNAMAANANNYSTPAVQGYDVVSYFTGKRPVRGNGNFVAVHDGATYQFSSADNQKAFEKNPDKYVPAFGGYCAFGVSVGKKFIGDPEVWRIVDERLYLNLDTGIQSERLKDVPGRIKTANTNWRSIKDKDPQSL